MHVLAREVRFSVNPFLPVDARGYNSYCSRPSGQGLAIFLTLTVELAGPVDPDTGFVMNIVQVDQLVRRHATGIFAQRIRQDYARQKHIEAAVLADLCVLARRRLAEAFAPAIEVGKITLNLNPFRSLSVEQTGDMVYLSERFEFAATHTLWNDKFSQEKNLEVFGKCANRAGHGHNYIVDVTVAMPRSAPGLHFSDFERVVDAELIEYVDHKNLNVEIAEFARVIPTVENIAVFAWDRLAGRFAQPVKLHSVKVWESDKTWCSYYGK